MLAREVFTPGQVIEVSYPMQRIEAEPGDDWGVTWKPGTWVEAGQYSERWLCDGVGAMILRVVSLHDPGRPWGPRVFYTRSWRAPDGRVFGKRRLRNTTVAAFRTLSRGYRFSFEVKGALG
jgi:hypothetical protein